MIKFESNITERDALRRTGRTTAIMAAALSNLIMNGRCLFQDHRIYPDLEDTVAKMHIKIFKERMTGFLGYDCTDMYDFKHIKNGIISIQMNDKHPLYSRFF